MEAQNKWLGKIDFKDSVLDFAKRIGVRVHVVSIRPMKNKWASCSTNGNLSFNIELLDLDRELGEYVIVHELLHFHIPNHGKLWKSLMTAYLGNYEQKEAKLKQIS